MIDFIGHALHSVGERIDGWRKYQQAYRELTGLDDRSLADIGVTRSEIPFILSHISDPSRVKAVDTANQNQRQAA
ncbi:MAG TPA: DUF1127 domain-containing protein [Stellaceae bacterium]|jgi:uncharacterized protein YjiS (DUF1127 family)|nr:DUF1127 domain-containing protein [Stellaceae bacterium]